MEHTTLRILGRDWQKGQFHIYYSGSQATVLCDGAISTAYLVPEGLCVRTLEKTNGLYTDVTMIGDDLDVFYSNLSIPNIRFNPNHIYGSRKIPDRFSSPDSMVTALFAPRNKDMNTFADLSSIVEKHFNDLRKQKEVRHSTERILLENDIGVKAFAYFVGSSEMSYSN